MIYETPQPLVLFTVSLIAPYESHYEVNVRAHYVVRSRERLRRSPGKMIGSCLESSVAEGVALLAGVLQTAKRVSDT
jgi:hypothetical protein